MADIGVVAPSAKALLAAVGEAEAGSRGDGTNVCFHSFQTLPSDAVLIRF